MVPQSATLIHTYLTQERAGEVFGVSQVTVSRRGDLTRPAVGAALAPLVLHTRELAGQRTVLADGTIAPTWNWGAIPHLYADEPWTLLRCNLTEPVKNPGVRMEVIGPEQAHVRAAVHRASFGSPKFTDQRWYVMAAGLAYADARCLVAYDDQDNAVAAVTVWSAGPGKPGLLEPMGVHQTIAATATVRRSPSPRRPHSSSWARRARSYAPRTPMSALSPPTSQPASSASRRGWTSPGPPSTPVVAHKVMLSKVP
jgi:hypothetical protein